MFNNFPIIVETKNIDSRIIIITWPFLVIVKHDEITLSNSPFKMNPFPGVTVLHSLKIFDERLLPIRHVWIVLYVYVADILLHCVTRFTLIEHQIIKCLRRFFVFLQIVVHGAPS